MIKFSIEMMYHQLTPFSQLPLKPNAGEKLTYLRTERKRGHIFLLQLTRLPLCTPNARLVKSMHHGLIMSRSVVQGGSTTIKWESRDLYFKGAGKAYQPSTLSWKDSYGYGQCHVYERYFAPRFIWRRIVPTLWHDCKTCRLTGVFLRASLTTPYTSPIFIVQHCTYTQENEFACRFSHQGGEKQRCSLFPYRSDPSGQSVSSE